MLCCDIKLHVHLASVWASVGFGVQTVRKCVYKAFSTKCKPSRLHSEVYSFLKFACRENENKWKCSLWLCEMRKPSGSTGFSL